MSHESTYASSQREQLADFKSLETILAMIASAVSTVAPGRVHISTNTSYFSTAVQAAAQYRGGVLTIKKADGRVYHYYHKLVVPLMVEHYFAVRNKSRNSVMHVAPVLVSAIVQEIQRRLM